MTGNIRSSGLHSVSNHGRINRRAFLKRAGIGAASVVVVAGSGTTWRAFDQGVFDTSQGPAYEAWNDWDEQGGEPLLPLVRAAVLAASAS